METLSISSLVLLRRLNHRIGFQYLTPSSMMWAFRASVSILHRAASPSRRSTVLGSVFHFVAQNCLIPVSNSANTRMT